MIGYVTAEEAAAILGVVPSRVRQLVLAGDLPAQKVGKAVLIIATSDIAKLKKKRIKRSNGHK
jgi:excisionase family DNA binding protein